MCVRSVHPYAPFVPENAVRLIVGSIPPARFCAPGQRRLCKGDVDFYYGSRSNGFWPLMAAVMGRTLDYTDTPAAVDQRKALLTELRTGVTDVIASCVHTGGSAGDDALADLTYQDIRSLLRQHPSIDTLLYTSGFIAGRMNAAGIPDRGRHQRWDSQRKNGSVVIGGRTYTVRVLYSPSPNALRRVGKEERLAQYRDVFRPV